MLSPNTQSQAIRPWQRQLSEAVSNLDQLLTLLALDRQQLPNAWWATDAFPLRVPLAYVARMRPGDPRDPLLLQVLPVVEEQLTVPGFGGDPLAEAHASPTPGLLHKYHGRVLLITTGACGIHCRYCFRRHFPYAEHQSWSEQWGGALAYITADSSLEEVILSGGDPLSVSDGKLAELVTALAEIPHVRRLRVHTRMPIVLPDRVDSAMLEWLTATRLQSVMVLHANHPQEIDQQVREALSRLRDRGIVLLNQAVLLRGINDDVAVLEGLCQEMFSSGVLPYYLSLLDRVAGAAHFEVDEKVAKSLLGGLIARLPGYMIPRLVREQPDAVAKLPVDLGLY